ncbi:hypothetical protein ACN9ML_10650 [Dyadobacter endophyticus]|uniref:Lipoprotein n=1 Tax=Dyadobacter endophyticus TaxID=1749036 RepID=A0ABQ1YQ61_9BACT|nr:hypothetical protein [Dyadobacter endophyticus]GGH32289.1 hypothetical protein GCM10007423_21720 [Dyadobacter endophyticus]
MKKIRLVGTGMLLLSLLSFVACDHNNQNVKPDPGSELNGDYERIMKSRADSRGVPFEIPNIVLTGNTLAIDVKGGCSADDFKTIWNGEILESYPQQINLVVANESNNDGCDPKGSYTLQVDLKKLIGDSFNPTDFVVRVSNGSKVADKVVDEKGSVSNL